VVPGQLPFADGDGSRGRVDVGHVADDHVDTASFQPPQGPCDPVRAALAGHHPQVGGGEGELGLAVDEHDSVAAVEAATETVRGGDPPMPPPTTSTVWVVFEDIGGLLRCSGASGS